MSAFTSSIQRLSLRAAALACRPSEAPNALSSILTVSQRATLASILDTLVRTSVDAAPDPELMTASLAFIDTWLRRLPEQSASELMDLLTVWEVQSQMVGPHRGRFSRLSAAERAANLERWATSPSPTAQSAFRALKTVCMLAWWSRPQTWQGLGYTIVTRPLMSDTPISSGVDVEGGVGDE